MFNLSGSRIKKKLLFSVFSFFIFLVSLFVISSFNHVKQADAFTCPANWIMTRVTFCSQPEFGCYSGTCPDAGRPWNGDPGCNRANGSNPSEISSTPLDPQGNRCRTRIDCNASCGPNFSDAKTGDSRSCSGNASYSCNGTSSNTCGSGSTCLCTGSTTYACTGTQNTSHCEQYTWAVRSGVCASGAHASVAQSFCDPTDCCNGPTTYKCTGAANNCEQYTWATRSGVCASGAHAGGQAQNKCCPNGQSCNNGACTSPTFIISGNVYVDTNKNGVKDAGESNTSGATVSRTGVSSGSTSTDSSGNFSFSGLNPGAYTVTLSVPNGFSTTTTNPVARTLGPNTTVNFGIAPNPTPIPAFTITGNVFIDSNKNGIKDASDGNFNSITVTCSGAGGSVQTTNASGNYTCSGLSAGAHNVTATIPSSAWVATTANPVSRTLGPNATANFGIGPVPSPTPTFTPTPTRTPTPTPTPTPKPGVPTPTFTPTPTRTPTPTPTPTPAPLTYIMNGNVYDDNNGNGFKDVGETGHQNVSVRLSSGQNTTTAANGNYSFNNLAPATRTISITLPPNYSATTPISRSITVPPNATVNFGIEAPAPTCSSLTYAPNSAVTTAGETRTLTLTCSGVTGVPTYNWSAATGNVPATSGTNTTTWTATQNTINTGDETVAGQVCDQATGLCSVGTQTQIPVTVSHSIRGNVYLDGNKSGAKDIGEGNYSGSITINCSSNGNPCAGATITYPSNGTFTINNLNTGTYAISYSGLPSGYTLTGPIPALYSVSVGSPCAPAASCDASGNVSNLNFGITNSNPWIQAIGGDITGDNISQGGGFTDQIPAGATCGSYASINGAGGTPGIVYSGGGSANFGSGQASANPYNWVVGGLTYPNVYTPSTAGIVKTSYSYIDSVAKQANLTQNNLTSVQGCSNLANCQLPGAFGNGVYKANGSVTLTGASYTFPANKNFIILVNGDLTIKTQLHVPIGSTLLFTVSGNIYVDPSVGESVITSTTANLEGYFSTDKSFYVQGTNVCPTSDLRLNVAGAIVVNAALAGGSFVNERDLCAGDNQCPVFSITERPDFVLYSPNFLQTVRRVWQEVAP